MPAETPADLLYTKSHEWVRVEDGVATVGITDHAQQALNDIVYVELPEPGARFAMGDELGVVESVKSVSDLYMPVSGTVTEVNEGLSDAPEVLNQDPYGAGWLIRVRMDDPDETNGLMQPKEYTALVADEA